MSLNYAKFKVGKYYIGKNVDKSIVVFKILRKDCNQITTLKVLRDDNYFQFTLDCDVELFNHTNYGYSGICFTNAVEIKDDAKLLALLM